MTGLVKNPEAFTERKRSAVKTLAELGKWPHCNHEEASHVNEFDSVIDKRAGWGHIPGGVLRDDAHGPVNDYTWQVFAETVADVVGKDRGEVESLLADERDWENTETATDGSKGQARAAHHARLLTYEWLLGEADG